MRKNRYTESERMAIVGEHRIIQPVPIFSRLLPQIIKPNIHEIP